MKAKQSFPPKLIFANCEIEKPLNDTISKLHPHHRVWIKKVTLPKDADHEQI